MPRRDRRRAGIDVIDVRRGGLGAPASSAQIVYPSATISAGNWLPSDTTLAGDTSDQDTGTYAYLGVAGSESTMILELDQYETPWSNAPGATLYITWQQVEAT